MSLVTEQHSMRNPRAVLHWYDVSEPYEEGQDDDEQPFLQVRLSATARSV
jgi:hypothetical protein